MESSLLVSDMVNLIEYLSYVYGEIQENGFVSWKDHKQNKSIFPTSHRALLALEEKKSLSPEAKSVARDMILWTRINSTSEEALLLVARPRIPCFKSAKAAALMQMYLTREEREERRDSLISTSQYRGKIGDRGTFDLLVSYKNFYGKNMARSNFHLCADDDGNSFVFSSHKYSLENGEKYRITARLIAHEEYNGIKQNRLGFIEKVVSL